MIYFKGETKMKKIIATLLATAMIVGCAISASAYGTDTATAAGQDTGANFNILANYKAGEREDVYKVNITWGDMKFNYQAGNEKWNTEKHQWEADTAEGKTAAVWSVATEGGDVIKFENHSSKDVVAHFAYAAKDPRVAGDVSATTTVNDLTIKRQPIANEGEALTNDAKAETQVVMSGALDSRFNPQGTADLFKEIGTLTITFTAE